MFESLSDRLSNVFRSFRGISTLNEENVKAGLREVRLALLEADVNYKVVGSFIEKVREKCLGQEVIRGVSPQQQVVSIVNEQLIELLGGDTTALSLQGQTPAVIMMVGLQGSGKTTSAAKIANYLRKQKMRPYLVPADVYRPAAIDQLVVLAKQLAMPYFPSTTDMNPVEIAKQAMERAREEQASVVIIDTAGRLHVDEVLMRELSDIKSAVNPQEILFVADAMTGQDAVTVAETFNEKLGISGVVLTKMDGDARGGAALSIKSVTGAPVKFVGMGEKLSELEVFHPDRIAGRILGMGDVVTLVERAQETIKAEEAEELAKKMRKATFDLEDFLVQMRRVKKLGSLQSIMKLIPGMSGLSEKLAEAGNLPEKELARVEAIIQSMTPQERHDPDILNGSRRARIARGAGVTVQQVNNLVRQFEQMRKTMKTMMGGKGKMPKGLGQAMKGLGRGGMPMGMPNMPNMPGMPGMPGLPGGMPQDMPEGAEGAMLSQAKLDKLARDKKKKRKDRRKARRK
ncbi:signal recognition particle protein [Desulfovibrio sp. An276]|uniref:signal recognition particle protein n=1 Tax=Desulfovibrio sp. An276 TaxID=1965618 RepID=UPI000B36AFA5|nr:signal recognition particle protein [Desulfovibrio sp. An276]OUO55075.1 signal recognition particle protein [Desulfovibrio sp. An276]